MLKIAVDRIEVEMGGHPLVAEMIKFIRESKRGVMRPTGDRSGDDGE